MSNPNDKGRDQAHEDALKALHGMGISDEESKEREEDSAPEDAPPAESEDSGPSPSASGFVGMLAKQGKDASGGGLDASETASPSDTATSDAAQPAATGTDHIYMAKEIKDPSAPGAPLSTTPAPVPSPTALSATPAKATRRVKPAPGWYHAAIPVMYTLSGILLLIGFWAIGALIFMGTTNPKGPAVSYPFLYAEENLDAITPGIFLYTQWTRLIVWTMLLCFPVSLALGIMAGIMQRHIRATQQK